MDDQQENSVMMRIPVRATMRKRTDGKGFEMVEAEYAQISAGAVAAYIAPYFGLAKRREPITGDAQQR